MSNVVVKGIIPSNGDPEGLVSAQKGALFFKTGSIYKVNYGGMTSANWQNVVFSPFDKSRLFWTEADLMSIPVPFTGAFVYEKTIDDGNDGWVFLTNKAPTYTIVPSDTPTPTPTRTPVPTISPTHTPTPTVTATVTPTHTVTPSKTAIPTHTPTKTPTQTPTLTPTNSSTPSITSTPTITSTFTPTPTITPTITDTPTLTLVPTSTVTPTITDTPGISPTPEVTVTPTITDTPTGTPTGTPTPTVTPTPTETPLVGPGGGIITITSTESPLDVRVVIGGGNEDLSWLCNDLYLLVSFNGGIFTIDPTYTIHPGTFDVDHTWSYVVMSSGDYVFRAQAEKFGGDPLGVLTEPSLPNPLTVNI